MNEFFDPCGETEQRKELMKDVAQAAKVRQKDGFREDSPQAARRSSEEGIMKMDQNIDERYTWKDRLFELRVAHTDQGYSVTIFEDGNAQAVRIYTVGYLVNMKSQSAYVKEGVQALIDLAKQDIQKGWLNM